MIKAINRTDERYEFENGFTMQREFQGLTPNGNKYAGRWVLRDEFGFVIDFDVYRNDIADRNVLDIHCIKISED